MMDKNSFLVVYPDTVINMDMLSAAAFLYFQKPIAIALPPAIVIEESYDILYKIESCNPDWKEQFAFLFNSWRFQQYCYEQTTKILEPLNDKYVKNIWSIYPANVKALEEAENLIKCSSLEIDSVYNMINPVNASGEIIRHIMLESYLEQGRDINLLYKYCDSLFGKEKLEELLTKGYLLRLNLLKTISKSSSILLTNQAIWNNLLDNDLELPNNSEDLDRDVISWEIFRQLVSPHLDPLDQKRVLQLMDILTNRKEEIERLKLKCYSLSEKIKADVQYAKLSSSVQNLIKTEVQREVADLLMLDKRALEDLFYDIFSDEKAWIAISAFIGGIVSGNTSITTGGAISALSFIGSKSVKSISKKRQEFRKNDYGLVYTISRKVK